MSTLIVLKEYLVGDGGYLLNDDNNGKTVMLSGAWGSGKTYFWQNEIEPKLFNRLNINKKTCVYVSLYGKDSLEEIKQEVFFKASTEKDYLSDDIEVFGYHALSTMSNANGAVGTMFKTIIGLNKYRRESKGKNKLNNGGLICFDDFERKSKNVDLNDLFGFITQLADKNCKVAIILNSDVFKGEEANKFIEVKEKTVNKFFYFNPTIKELFKSIFYTKTKDKKYKYSNLKKYKKEILQAIIETKERNARIYIQVLDNCCEWLNQYDYEKYELRALVMITINFLKNHFVFNYKTLPIEGNPKLYSVLEKYYKDYGLFEISNYFIKIVPQFVNSMSDEEFEAYFSGDRTIAPVGSRCGCEEFLHLMHSSISKKEEDSNGKSKSASYYEKLDKVFYENKDIFYALNFYAYVLKVEHGISKDRFDEINQFVKSGILLPRGERL